MHDMYQYYHVHMYAQSDENTKLHIVQTKGSIKYSQINGVA
jgi:hypothetical protein